MCRKGTTVICMWTSSIDFSPTPCYFKINILCFSCLSTDLSRKMAEEKEDELDPLGPPLGSWNITSFVHGPIRAQKNTIKTHGSEKEGNARRQYGQVRTQEKTSISWLTGIRFSRSQMSTRLKLKVLEMVVEGRWGTASLISSTHTTHSMCCLANCSLNFPSISRAHVFETSLDHMVRTHLKWQTKPSAQRFSLHRKKCLLPSTLQLPLS